MRVWLRLCHGRTSRGDIMMASTTRRGLLLLRRRLMAPADGRAALSTRGIQTPPLSPAETTASDGPPVQPARRQLGVEESELPPPIAAAMALVDRLEGPDHQSIGLQPDWFPDASAAGLTAVELTSAKRLLRQMNEEVEQECSRTADATRIEFQRKRQHVKATTRHLDRLLTSLLKRKQYKEIEAITFLWDDVFPEYATNPKHWTVLCEYYAVALNKQQRFEEVLEKFLANWRAKTSTDDEGEQSNASEVLFVTPAIANAVFTACGHLGAADSALQLMAAMRNQQIPLSKVACFHIINTFLKANRAGDFDSIVQTCEAIVNDCEGHIPTSLLPTIIKLAAERGELDRVMPLYSLRPYAPMDGLIEYRFDVCLLTLWKMRNTDEMLEILGSLLESHRASQAAKARICKGLLRKSLDERNEDCKQLALKASHGILDLMERNRIRMSTKTVKSLLSSIMEDDHSVPFDEILDMFHKYPHIVQWNSFVVCELIIIAIRLKRYDLVHEAMVHALDNDIPIKYVAIEVLVSHYYQTGTKKDCEHAADIIQSIRLNKYIQLGMSVTEMGMFCNYKLGRYRAVINLFEDFSRLDGDRKRLLSRKPMLVTAMNAFTKLGRIEEATAIGALLSQHHPSGVDDSTEDDIGTDAVVDPDDLSNLRVSANVGQTNE